MSTVLHIPHGSDLIPDDVRDQFLLSSEDLRKELLAMTDAHTGLLFSGTVDGAVEVVFPISRLVVDPERFAADDDEPMARVGMGAIYTKTSKGSPLRRRLADTERQRLMNHWYVPHHVKLTSAVESALAEAGSCLIVDCHSFPSRVLPYEMDQNPLRPDICIGVDSKHTPGDLARAVICEFRALGLDVAVNRPFGGAIVPMKFFGTDLRVASVMFEVNRRLYMDENTGQADDANLAQMRFVLKQVLTKVVS